MDPIDAPYESLFLNHEINARGPIPDAAVADLVASIPARGLLQPLLVRHHHNEALFEVVEGSRRWRAIGILREQGLWPLDAPVPVHVMPMTDNEAREASLIANVQRMALSPAEEARAFTRLARDGKKEGEIAAHFGIPLRRVQQRLAIGGLPDPIIAALADGTITVDVAEAFTLAPDTASQIEVFEQCSNGGHFNAYSIRTAFTGKAVRAGSLEAGFVGEADYAAAGGFIRRDLFSDNVWFEDGALVTRLFDEKLKATAKALREEGWAEVVTVRHGKPDIDHLQRAKPAEKVLGDEAKARLAAIRARIAAIDDMERSAAPAPSAALRASYEAMADEARALRAEEDGILALAYTPRQKKAGMAAIVIGHNKIDIARGLLKPKQKGKAADAGGGDDDDADAGADAPAPQAAPSGQAEEADFAGKLLEDLSIPMDEALRQAFVDKPQAGYFCMVASLIMNAQHRGYGAPMDFGNPRHSEANSDGYLALLERFESEGEEGTQLDFAEILARLETMDPMDFVKLAGGLMARHLTVLKRLGDANAKALIARMDPDVQSTWAVDAAFFKRLKARDLLLALEDIDDGAVAKHGRLKKPQLVEIAARDLPPRGWLPKPLRTPGYALKEPQAPDDILPREVGEVPSLREAEGVREAEAPDAPEETSDEPALEAAE